MKSCKEYFFFIILYIDFKYIKLSFYQGNFIIFRYKLLMKKFLFFITLLFSINLVTAKDFPANILMNFYLQEQPYTKSKLYPNPAVNFILVKNSSSYKIDNISVLSMVGTNLIDKDIIDSNLNQEINISKLPTGRYFVKVTYSDGSREILTLIKL